MHRLTQPRCNPCVQLLCVRRRTSKSTHHHLLSSLCKRKLSQSLLYNHTDNMISFSEHATSGSTRPSPVRRLTPLCLYLVFMYNALIDTHVDTTCACMTLLRHRCFRVHFGFLCHSDSSAPYGPSGNLAMISFSVCSWALHSLADVSKKTLWLCCKSSPPLEPSFRSQCLKKKKKNGFIFYILDLFLLIFICKEVRLYFVFFSNVSHHFAYLSFP